MIRQSTIDKLHDMRLSAMSDAFECQCKDPDTYQRLSFEDREYSCAATPQIRQTGNRLSGLAETAYASLLAQCFV